jgi:tetratricopeptide (TPR) repeat protein
MAKKANPSARVDSVSQVSVSLRIAAVVCASIVFAWAMFGANSARIAEAHWKKARAVEQTLGGRDWQGSDEEYIDLIRHAVSAADCEPANVKYHHWLNVYRWQSINRVTDPNSDQIMIAEQSMEFVRRIIDELNSARLLCPTYGAICSVAGQLERFILEDPNGAERIRQGFRLAPSDPTACFVAGLLDVEQGDVQAAYAKFSRAVQLDTQLDGNLFEEISHLCIERLDRPDLAVTLAGESTSRLSYVANALFEIEQRKEPAEKARVQVVTLLKKKCSQPDAPAGALASLASFCRWQGDYEEAIEHYRRALALDYSQVQWRFKLAQVLAETGKIPEAIHEARIGLRLQPKFEAAEELIAYLSTLPGAVTEDNPSP